MDGRIDITEDEAWAEIDKYFNVNHKEDDEYDAKYFMRRYGLKRTSAIRRLRIMEDDGILSSRLVLDGNTMTRVWKFVKSESAK